MTNKTNIKFTQVKKQSKENRKTEVYEFEDGSTITYNPIFPQTEIEKLYENLQKVLMSSKDEMDELLTDGLMQKLVMFHMIKQFTHFKSQLKADTLVGQLEEMEALMDMELDGKSLFTFIVTELFMTDQLIKVFDGLSSITSQMLFIQDFEKQTQEKLKQLKDRSEIRNVLSTLN